MVFGEDKKLGLHLDVESITENPDCLASKGFVQAAPGHQGARLRGT